MLRETPKGSKHLSTGVSDGLESGGASRRSFLGGTGLAAVGAVIGGTMPFSKDSGVGVSEALAQGAVAAPAAAAAKGPQPLKYPGKDSGLVVLGDRPLVAETPEIFLDDDTTPTEKFFIRNNGLMPEETKDPDNWKLVIDGEVTNKVEITLGELKKKFKPVTRRLVIECGGNGRSFFNPQARGNQWTNGGIGCAEWTGVKLSDVLKTAGVKKSAVFSAHFGADPHLSGEKGKDAISRGVPIKKLMDENNLLVWAMNGETLPMIHGFPLRLIVPGWPGSVSAKWVTRIWIRDKIHDGQGMGGTSYRVPINPMVPGDKVDEKNFRDLESMPIRSIITNPSNGLKVSKGIREMTIRGAAWAGDNAVKEVHVSLDYGATWQKAKLAKPKNKYDWQRWDAKINFPSDGYFEIWTRGTDSKGVMQPHVAGNWNPQGYGGNPMHRIAVLIG
jgi:sulfite oxidase